MQAPRGGQLKINGNIVNVSAEVNTTISMLPRLPNENGTINIKLKSTPRGFAFYISSQYTKQCSDESDLLRY